ncbi:MAG TPA: TOBE domain-containing protein [Spirochaetota bacterium]|nr:TOBE domain-containing protein [Spirochaetota bacterium]
MKYGAQNNIVAKVKSIKSGDVMAQIKFDVVTAKEMSSVITTDSVKALDLREGDTVHLVIKAIHVLPVKE